MWKSRRKQDNNFCSNDVDHSDKQRGRFTNNDQIGGEERKKIVKVLYGKEMCFDYILEEEKNSATFHIRSFKVDVPIQIQKPEFLFLLSILLYRFFYRFGCSGVVLLMCKICGQ
jgi:hypothetical protein